VQAYWIARHYRYKRDLEAIRARPDVTLHVLPHGQPLVMRYNDFTRTAELIATAYEASGAYLDALVPSPGREAAPRTADGVLA
jgi:hypothetical protein